MIIMADKQIKPDEYVTKDFCNERFERIQGNIQVATQLSKNEIVGDLRKEMKARGGLSIGAKAAIAIAIITGSVSIATTLIDKIL